MISPELLRRYPFFGNLNDDQLKTIAMRADEVAFNPGETLFLEGKFAEVFYLLMQGSVDLFYAVETETGFDFSREFPVGEINAGEPFGLSAVMEPYVYSASARADGNIRVISIDGPGLRALLEADKGLSCIFMHKVAKAFAERLRSTRIQLAAARI